MVNPHVFCCCACDCKMLLWSDQMLLRRGQTELSVFDDGQHGVWVSIFFPLQHSLSAINSQRLSVCVLSCRVSPINTTKGT